MHNKYNHSVKQSSTPETTHPGRLWSAKTVINRVFYIHFREVQKFFSPIFVTDNGKRGRKIESMWSKH